MVDKERSDEEAPVSDGEARANDEAPADSPAPAPAAKPRAEAPLFPRASQIALLLCLGGTALAAQRYVAWANEYARDRPKIAPCFIVAKLALKQPELESGTEPQENEAGETVYLSPKKDRAVRCSVMIGEGKSVQRRLTTILTEEDVEARATKLESYLRAIPQTAEGDAEANAFGNLIEPVFGALVPSEATILRRNEATDLVECRFNSAGCRKRQSIPAIVIGALGVGAAGLLYVIATFARAVLDRRRGAGRGRSRAAVAATTLATLALTVLAACQPSAPPAEPAPVPAAPAPSAPPVEAPPPAVEAPPPPAEVPSASKDPAASKAPAAPGLMPGEAAPSPACPGDMILVDGDYCTDVEHECLKSWYDKSNKKEVCEEFAPGKAKCTGSKVHKRFCIDRFAWPNVRGERPEVMNNFYQAQIKCAAVDKRICTESEWTMSCEGPEMKPFPYGYKRDPTKCNGDHLWDEPNMKAVGKRDPKELARLWQGVPNGAQPECISDYGVPDLPGNTDDIASSETYSSDYRGKFDSVTTGGPWYKGTRNQCRPKIYTHDEGFYYYYLGFRCCAEADGKPTDPRTPKQRKDDWKFSRVEGLGRFTAAQMKEKLEQKKAGKCSCKEKDTLCKTMCGTLLGPNVKDADLKAPRP